MKGRGVMHPSQQAAAAAEREGSQAYAAVSDGWLLSIMDAMAHTK